MGFFRTVSLTAAFAVSAPASAGVLSPADATVTMDGKTVIAQDVYTPWDILDIVTTSSASCAIFDGAGRNVATVYPKASGSSYKTTYTIKGTDAPGDWRMNCGGSISEFVVDDVHQLLWLPSGGFDKIVDDYLAAGGPKSTWWNSLPAVNGAPMSWVNSSAWYYQLDVALPGYSYAFASKIPRRNGTVVGGATTEPWETAYSGGGLAVSTALQRLALAASTFDAYMLDSSTPYDAAEKNVDEYEKAAIYWGNYIASIPDWSNPVLPGAYKDSSTGKFVYCGLGTCYTKDSAGNKVAFYGTKTQLTTTFDDLERGQMLIGLAAAYDWMHDRLTPGQRRTWRNKLIKEAISYRTDEGLPRPWSTYGSSRLGNLLTNSHIFYDHAAPAIVAMVLYDEMAATPSIRDQWLNDADVMFDKALALYKSDGADHQGVGYWEFTLDVMIRYFEAARTIRGDSSYYQSAWMQNTPKFLDHMTYPNGQRVNFGDSEYYDRGTLSGLLARLASQYKSPYIQRLAWEGHNKWSYPDKTIRRDVLEILWWDEGVTPLGDKNQVARNRCFVNKGFTSVRTGWDKKASMLSYRGAGIIGSHDDPDVGSFVMYDEGHLVTSDGINLVSKRTAVHSTFLVDGKGQHGDGLDMMTFPPQSTSGNDTGKLTTYLDNSARSASSTSKAPNVVTMGSDLTQMYRYDSTDVLSHGSTNVEATGKKLYELTRYLVWLGHDATLVFDRWSGSAAFRMDWNLATGTNVDLNNDGVEDSANPDTCPVKKGTRAGYGQYKDGTGKLYDVLLKNDVATVCAGSSCTTSGNLPKLNMNQIVPVKDTTFTKYTCDAHINVQSANGRVTVKADDSIGGRLDVVPMEPNRSNWDKQLSPFLSGSSVQGVHLNRRQNAATGQFLTALLPWSANDPLQTTVASTSVTGGSHVTAKLPTTATANVWFASPGQSQVKTPNTTLTGVLGVVVEDSAYDPLVAQLVNGTSLVHRGRTFVSATAPVHVGLTFESNVAYGSVKVNNSTTAITVALPDFTAAKVTKVEVAGKPVSFTAVTGGIKFTAPQSGTLTIYGGATGTIANVSSCW